MSKPITKFAGEYRFLSNFYPCEIEYDGQIYNSVEHAYVAAKTLDTDIREVIQNLKTAKDARKFGKQHVTLRSDWNEIKVPIMRNLVKQKFQDKELYEELLATFPSELIEGNYWKDTFWGQCPIGKGKNILGKILMEIRDDISVKF